MKFFARYIAAALVLLAALVLPDALQTANANGDTRALNMYHNHTGERINIVYKRDGRYDRDALEKLNWFLRDWRKNKSIEMDPQLLDLVWEVYRDLGASSAIHIICGYRDEVTNEMLRGRSVGSGVAQHSQHTQGRAMDISIPGVPTERLRAMGMRKQRGGVGYYRSSGFVHLDIANVRAWPRMSTQQLAQLFPNGETLHLPSDGPPLPGYQMALAKYGRDGKRGRDDDIQVASVENDAAAQRGILRRSVAQEETAAPPSLSEKLGPVLAALPEPKKDTSRLTASPVPAAAPLVVAALTPKAIAPQPQARPQDLPLQVAMAEAEAAPALPRPLELVPKMAAFNLPPIAKPRVPSLTAPNLQVASSTLTTSGNAAQKLTAPKLQLASQFLDAPLTTPKGFTLRGVMKQAGFMLPRQRFAQS